MLRIGEAGGAQVAGTPANVSQPTNQVSTRSSGNNINLIDFRRGDNNAGRIMISLSNPDAPVSLVEQGGKIIIDFSDARLAEELQKRFDVTDFATPVLAIEAFPSGDNVRIIVQPDGNLDYEHLAYQSDNLYVLEVREIPKEVIEARRRENLRR